MMKHLFNYFSLALFFSVVCSLDLMGQEPRQPRDQGHQLYLEYQYTKALPIYLKLVDREDPKLADLERIAEIYFKMNQYEAAENWYSRVVQHAKRNAESLLLYGEVLKINGRYAEAKAVFERYASETGDGRRVANTLAGCDSALLWMAHPTLHQIINQTDINTPLAEFSTMMIGNQLYYTGEPKAHSGSKVYGRTGNAFLQVFSAEQLEDRSIIKSTRAMESWNEQTFHVGPISSNQAGTVLFVTRTYPGKQGELSKIDQLNLRTHKLELLIFKKDERGEWMAQPFVHNKIQEYSTGHATLSPDEKILYFVSDMPHGYGGTDIWYSEQLPNGEWGHPVNAGGGINSSGDEQFPSMGADGVLHFSSNGFPGMGGLDIFRSEGNRNRWTKPKNLAYPINSAADDFSFVRVSTATEKEVNYLSSNRKDGVGGDDIYLIRYQKPAVILVLEGISYDKQSKDILGDVAVTLSLTSGELQAKQYTAKDGRFTFQLDPEKEYKLKGQKTGYYSDSAAVSTMGMVESDTLYAALYLEPLLEVGTTLTLENIYYDFDKHAIRSDAAAVLDELIRILRDNPTMNIELASHTDSRGADQYNQRLSQRRAQAAVDYLVTSGIARDRLIATGYGESQLVNHCDNGQKCSEEEHQKNRRTTFTVLGY